MWKCLNCAEEVENTLAVCWSCQADQTGVVPESSVSAQDTPEERSSKVFLNEKFRPKNCLRCDVPLRYAGTKEFHEGVNLGALGDFAELFVNRTNLEMYVCSRCLQVEFFASDPID